MKGDFSRHTFDETKHFSRVLLQQGRVQLDADWNEQVAILLHYLQVLATDLIGEHGGPIAHAGFEILPGESRDFTIGSGRYYVQGFLCENEVQEPLLTYTGQPDYPQPPDLQTGRTYLVYLEAWERLITAVEDGRIREVALGGPDTASRAKVVWQAKTTGQMPDGTELPAAFRKDDVVANWADWLELWQPDNRGWLKADAKKTAADSTDPCLIRPDARYRGAENQLYRVEIHTGGKVDEVPSPTFKWSRENGSVIFPIRALNGMVVSVEHLGPDGRLTLQPGDWVEIVDDDIVNLGYVKPLYKVQGVDRVELQVILEENPAYAPDLTKHPLLRRWEGYGPVTESEMEWLTLEDGLHIQFQAGRLVNQYRTGDYWIIPARTATGDIEWPEDEEQQPLAQRPWGHHVYAPLQLITVVGDGTVKLGDDCRYTFKPV